MSERNVTELAGSSRKELNYREADGIAVVLMWDERDNSLAVLVEDRKTEEAFELPATHENWREVFEHPYGYRGAGALAVAETFEQAA